MMWPISSGSGSDAFRDLERLQREMNRLFSDFTVADEQFPAINVWSNQHETLVTAEVPGIDPAQLSINVQGEVLTIEGERAEADVSDQATFHRVERGYGRFIRTVRLPYEIESDKVQAQYKLGVLLVSLPRAEASKPKRIQIAGA
ncbi:MAG: Hsp20/alpha crystallin family protein [Candidatus Marinimicrobia bacterium]|nr:Hsp20/alpha crystallin family protein [Candidatus Neomarinimicrobiota bacterium]